MLRDGASKLTVLRNFQYTATARCVAFFATVNLEFTGAFHLRASCSMQIEDVGGHLASLAHAAWEDIVTSVTSHVNATASAGGRARSVLCEIELVN